MLRWIRSLILGCVWCVPLAGAERPNVLWITSEDNGPHLGCYGDTYAVTPNLDALAAKGCRYLHCWSNAPVCAPARTTIITGMYPTSLGAEHMRSLVKLPEHIQLYPQYLRAAGYYCTNNSKTDYNVQPNGPVWDDSSNKAHWKNRPEGKPFFAIFNHTISHESQIRNAIDEQDRIHDPAGVRVPAYHPDTPEVRKDWAQYYDRLTMMDKLAGANLAELKAAGLEEETIVFYYADHGSGMPRSKRFPYNSGLHVPLIVYLPEKWKHLATPDYQPGGTSARLVSFVDLAPTLLSLVGADIPAHMQGHAFLGPQATEPQPYLYGFRGRMDERIDMMRSITDGRYVYLRNFMPHRPYGQYVDYMFQTPTTRVWYELWKRGECNEAQSHFWNEKPVEELYDLQSDPDEVVNLAGRDDVQSRLRELRQQLTEWMVQSRDLGFLPEAEIHRQCRGKSPYELGQELAERTIPVGRERREMSVVSYGIRGAASRPWAALRRDDLGDVFGRIQMLPTWSEPMTRYWSAMIPLAKHPQGLDRDRDVLRGLLQDDSPSVAIVAAEALGRYGDDEDLALALPVLLEYANAEKHGVYCAIEALNAIDYLDEKAVPIRVEVAKLPRKDPQAPDRTASYCDRLIEKILADLN
jgi:arylsulfatase A-like enzyme